MTKCDTVYYKLRQVLQSAMIITNCDSTVSKFKSNKGRETFQIHRWKPALQKPVDNRQIFLFRQTAQYINL